MLRVTPIDEKTIQMMINALGRFTLKKVVQDGPVIQWQVDHYTEEDQSGSEVMKAYSKAIISSVKELIKSNSLFQEELKLFLNRFTVEDPGKLADFVASMTSADSAEVQDILETFDVRKRVEKVLVLMKKEIELSKLQEKITKQIEQSISKQQKEFFLREQLKEIKKELGLEKDEKTTEIEKFEERLKKLKLTEEAAKKVDEEMNKLQAPRAALGRVRRRAQLPRLAHHAPLGRVLDGQLRHQEGEEDPGPRPLRPGRHQGPHPRIHQHGQDEGEHHRLHHLLRGPSGRGQDLHRQVRGRGAEPQVLPLLAGRHAGRGRDQGAPPHLHRRHAGQDHPEPEDRRAWPTRSSCSTRSTRSARASRATRPRRCSRCWTRSRTRNFLDHYIDVRFDLSNILFIARRTSWTPSPRRSWTAWR